VKDKESHVHRQSVGGPRRMKRIHPAYAMGKSRRSAGFCWVIRPFEVRNLFLRARELVKFHRHFQTRLYRETTSLYVTKLMRHALCPSISPNVALESDKARM